MSRGWRIGSRSSRCSSRSTSRSAWSARVTGGTPGGPALVVVRDVGRTAPRVRRAARPRRASRRPGAGLPHEQQSGSTRARPSSCSARRRVARTDLAALRDVRPAAAAGSSPAGLSRRELRDLAARVPEPALRPTPDQPGRAPDRDRRRDGMARAHEPRGSETERARPARAARRRLAAAERLARAATTRVRARARRARAPAGRVPRDLPRLRRASGLGALPTLAGMLALRVPRASSC